MSLCIGLAMIFPNQIEMISARTSTAAPMISILLVASVTARSTAAALTSAPATYIKRPGVVSGTIAERR